MDGYHINYLKHTNKIISLFVVLYEYQHKHFWYNRPVHFKSIRLTGHVNNEIISHMALVLVGSRKRTQE